MKINHLFKNSNYNVGRYWFDDDLVHFMDPRLPHIFWLRVASSSNYHRLLCLIILVELSYAFRGVVTILYGHVTVHKDQGVRATLFTCVLYHIESILAIKCPI